MNYSCAPLVQIPCRSSHRKMYMYTHTHTHTHTHSPFLSLSLWITSYCYRIQNTLNNTDVVRGKYFCLHLIAYFIMYFDYLSSSSFSDLSTRCLFRQLALSYISDSTTEKEQNQQNIGSNT